MANYLKLPTNKEKGIFKRHEDHKNKTCNTKKKRPTMQKRNKVKKEDGNL
jgi:hypothetical protein